MVYLLRKIYLTMIWPAVPIVRAVPARSGGYFFGPGLDAVAAQERAKLFFGKTHLIVDPHGFECFKSAHENMVRICKR